MTSVKTTKDNELPTEIEAITAEINAYQRVAGEAIFEIGRRLKHVKENDLVHGEWAKWCSEEIGMNRSNAQIFIRVFEELGGLEVVTLQHLGVRALYEIAQLPPSEREAEHITSKGETKTPDEMTVRELRELKRQLKDAQQTQERLERENEKLSNREPEVVTGYVEKEIEDRSDRDTYGLQLLDEFYRAADEASAWQKKFAWITHDADKLRNYARMDADMLGEYQKMRKMIEIMDDVFYGGKIERTIVEIIES